MKIKNSERRGSEEFFASRWQWNRWAERSHLSRAHAVGGGWTRLNTTVSCLAAFGMVFSLATGHCQRTLAKKSQYHFSYRQYCLQLKFDEIFWVYAKLSRSQLNFTELKHVRAHTHIQSPVRYNNENTPRGWHVTKTTRRNQTHTHANLDCVEGKTPLDEFNSNAVAHQFTHTFTHSCNHSISAEIRKRADQNTDGG